MRLVGPTRYGGALRDYAYLGDPAWPVDLDAGHLRRALGLILLCSVLALSVGLGLALLRG